ncbi:MAG: outer membrane lipoprotein-sorting protein [Pseudomonadales bacterium]|nr:outer membrane lipoprotein-sorting protein [Pseudomonadales bacterium]
MTLCRSVATAIRPVVCALGLLVQFGTVEVAAKMKELKVADPGLSRGVVLEDQQSELSNDPADERGYTIFAEIERRNSGYVDMRAELKMLLISSSGKRRHRALHIRQLENSERGDSVLIRFDSPRDIRGTGLLSKGNGDRADDQWLYLPAFSRVKKIAMKNRSGPFAGSEFSFEDLSVQEVEEFTYRFVDMAELDGLRCYVVERFSKDEYSAYLRQVVWVDKEAYRIRKVEYYDDTSNLVKTLHYQDFGLYQERFWKPHHMIMYNHRSKRTTELHWLNFKFSTGLNESRDFTTNSLKRAR